MRKTIVIVVLVVLIMGFESNMIHGGNVLSKPSPRKSSQLHPVMSPADQQPPSLLHLDQPPPPPAVDNTPAET